MIGDYIVVVFVLAIGVTFLGVIHHFWLRDAFREEATPLDGRGENKGGRKMSSVVNNSSSEVRCRASHSDELFNIDAMALKGKVGGREGNVSRERMPALSQTRMSNRS